MKRFPLRMSFVPSTAGAWRSFRSEGKHTRNALRKDFGKIRGSTFLSPSYKQIWHQRRCKLVPGVSVRSQSNEAGCHGEDPGGGTLGGLSVPGGYDTLR